MDKLRRKGLSRLLSYCLARRPDEFGLVPDEAGFVSLKELARALAEEPDWGFLREGFLREVCHGGPFQISDDDRIRSTTPPLPTGFVAEVFSTPATVLYVAAPRKAYAAIGEHGLRAYGGRPAVLAATADMALRIGRRRDHRPVLIKVRAAEAARCSQASFRRVGELLYLAEAVPVRFLDGPPPEKKVPLPHPAPQAAERRPPEPPGSCYPRLNAPPAPDADKTKSAAPRRRGEEPEWKRERRRRNKHREDDGQ
ncbi:MAG: hypothetical protein V2A77_11375 [Pseudomonadota bacterium]